MIWIWSIPDRWPNNRVGKYIKGSGIDRFLFREGKLIDYPIVVPKIEFDCSENFLYDVLPNNGFLIVVSKKVLEILSELCPNDFQSSEANVYSRGAKIPDYYLLNVISSLEVIDKEKSEYTTIPGSNAILRFDKLVYKFTTLNNHHIARNADYRSHVLVSDVLKNVFEKNKINGVQFN